MSEANSDTSELMNAIDNNENNKDTNDIKTEECVLNEDHKLNDNKAEDGLEDELDDNHRQFPIKVNNKTQHRTKRSRLRPRQEDEEPDEEEKSVSEPHDGNQNENVLSIINDDKIENLTEMNSKIKRRRMNTTNDSSNSSTDETKTTEKNNNEKMNIEIEDDDDDDDDDEDEEEEDEEDTSDREQNDDDDEEWSNLSEIQKEIRCRADESDTTDDEQNDVFTNFPKDKRKLLPLLKERSIGYFNHRTSRYFHNVNIGSLNMVRKMKISHKLEIHEGCVNALSFNRIGTLLASASDDLQIALWDWPTPQVAVIYDSGHTSNVFQAKFLPFSNDCSIVSCARDGQVRLAELAPDGTLRKTKKIAQHHASAHKLTVENITGKVIYSCGEDSDVFQIDIREDKPMKLLSVSNENMRTLPLYSISLNPSNLNEFLLCGMDPIIRVYDRRLIRSEAALPLKKFVPDALKDVEDRRRRPSVTCAVYNYNGSEILGSYNDEDIYLFDSSHSDGADAIKRYSGHRNSSTVKGVNFYGRYSEYIISGSDCGNVYIWDKNSQKCVWYDTGDEAGTVNVLEPHPLFPMFATSGLQHDIKIWMPLRAEMHDLKGLNKMMKRNARDRENELHGPLLRLMRPIFRRIARRAHGDDNEDSADDDSETDNENLQAGAYSFDCAPS
ncbi:unnamed protein product [Didymodactylos carnosus]|uniref:DDB1-and CUL4-associated factor 8 n=1 Tax=Didymodactylos carnosus TaxID=1234261 RepID=A0A814CQU1_9BILA|nr:unnamed protein product [Didymodactylos carnosus]CAF1091852.1 unnamed protein product [Didymodactylos carnosus]CAF3719769.1 unnamed protein product [Didymodactylos carnosus]CAF3853385.1 unnamed protein product [Didymodactylos carnosus]